MIWFVISLLAAFGTGIFLTLYFTMGSAAVTSGFSERIE